MSGRNRKKTDALDRDEAPTTLGQRREVASEAGVAGDMVLIAWSYPSTQQDEVTHNEANHVRLQ